jgi:hypothetical protein
MAMANPPKLTSKNCEPGGKKIDTILQMEILRLFWENLKFL